MKELFIRALFAGLFISLGCIAYLTIGGIFGAILFSFGLMSVCFIQLKLFTGYAWLCSEKSDYFKLIMILISNVLACLIIGNTLDYDTSGIVFTRLETSYITIFMKSILTGVIMTTAVMIYKKHNNLLGVLFGVPMFILCGFPHCIADAFYYSSFGWSFPILKTWTISVFGNFIGCSYNKILEK